MICISFPAHITVLAHICPYWCELLRCDRQIRNLQIPRRHMCTLNTNIFQLVYYTGMSSVSHLVLDMALVRSMRPRTLDSRIPSLFFSNPCPSIRTRVFGMICRSERAYWSKQRNVGLLLHAIHFSNDWVMLLHHQQVFGTTSLESYSRWILHRFDWLML